LDVVPISAGAGLGALARARVTMYFEVGAGWASSSRVGWRRRCRSAETARDELGAGGIAPWREADGRLVRWSEESRALPVAYSLTKYARADGNTREAGSVFTVFPVREQALLADPVTEIGSAFDVEAEVFLGVAGVRVGGSVVQLCDALAGWLGFDPLGDDEIDPGEPPDEGRNG
jgi:hypothetical protein